MQIRFPKILIDAIDNGHMIVDDKFIVHYWNKWLEINTRIEFENIVGKSLAEFYPELNCNVLGRKIRTALRLGTPSFYDQNSSVKFIPINRNKVTTSSLTHMQQQVTISPYIEEDRLVLISIYDISELHETKLLLKKEVEKVNKLNSELEERIEKALEANKAQVQHMILQSRQAQMGEMISLIAHQWRQPLGIISAAIIDMQMKIAFEKLDLRDYEKEYIDTKIDTINRCVQNLSTTIDDFRNFYKPNKHSETVKLEEICTKSLRIIKESLITTNINIIEEYSSEDEIELYLNEMVQVILNILKNSQDNFIEKKINNPWIKVRTERRTISICDNGGGIPEDIINNIFEPYFSTKNEKNGTGLGLYMSKTIIEEHHKGTIKAINRDEGVCFIMELGVIPKHML